jgi:hypothetical protein
MNNEISPLILLMDKSKERKPTKKEMMKKVFIISKNINNSKKTKK